MKLWGTQLRRAAMKPFWSNQLQDLAVDEICTCGHLKSEHGSQTIAMAETDAMLRVANEGGCCGEDCTCQHYEFARFIGKRELVEIHKHRGELCSCP